MSSSSVVPSREHQVSAEDTENHTRSEAKRRKVRKGTRSCWECKRRKMKCIFDRPTSTSCNGCSRRGSKCISQEFPEKVSLSIDKTSHEIGDGVARVETRIGQLIDNAGSNDTIFAEKTPLTPHEGGYRTDYGIPTPASINSGTTLTPAPHKSLKEYKVDNRILPGGSVLYKFQSSTDTPASQVKSESLSRFLHESLPSREDVERICKAIRHPSVLAHQVLTMSYTTLCQHGLKTPESFLEIPGPNLHPVLIARYMLQLAIFLQHLHPTLHEEIIGMSESPRVIMERLADLAISLVTTNDEFLGTIEGLECVMTESMYQVNVGNLRRSWIAGRRAMGIAQLMGLNRSNNRAQYEVLDPSVKYNPQFMWFRILFLDRHLSLMLGLSQGSIDCSIASDEMLANDTPMGRLDRIHCVIASRILERNESRPSLGDLTLTQSLDMELQKVARSMPSKWWLVPTLDTSSTDSQALFWDMQRLFLQVLHYNLLNQLYLPYMLCSSSPESQHVYSRITCVNASREVLSRFITLRSFNLIACSCRMIDFLALMAAMTLILAHLDSHRSEAENPLAHQFYSDRAMIEQAQDTMKEVNNLNSDALSAQSADLLRRLLAIQVEAADGYSGCAERVSVQESETESALPNQNDDVAVSVHIPYFGVIKIARDGMSKEAPKPQIATDTNSPSIAPQGVPDAYTKTMAQSWEPSISSTSISDNTINSTPLLQNGVSNPLLHHGEYPGLAAGGEDWAFQGVDMAFFDSLMRTTGNEGNEDVDWITW